VRHALGWIVALVLATSFCFGAWVLLAHDYDWARLAPYSTSLWKGWGVTLAISVSALLLSVAIGAGLTLGQLSNVAPARWLARTMVELIRGTPLLVQILIGYYLFANALGWEDKTSVGIVLLSVFAGAYLSEIFRGGVESIPGSQWESARAIGLTGAQTYRHVIIPQAIRRVLPATAGQFANLVKDSSLLYIIGVEEFFLQTRSAKSATYLDFETLIPLAVGYLILTLPISIWTRRMERKLRYAD
jgi:polar amino acid transport system permease protein